MATLYLSPVTMIVQYLTNLGIVASGAKVYTYQAGTVSTPATTYTDSTGLVPNANPMTVSSAGRPAAASGAPVSFWTLGGVAIKLLVTDAAGSVLVGPIDYITSINDLTSQNSALQTQLADPTSASTSGSGPVAGIDLVANGVKSYDIFASVRAANTPTPVSGQTIICAVSGRSAIFDGLGGLFYWYPLGSANDDNVNVIKPTSASIGRWLRIGGALGLYSAVLAADVGVASSTAFSTIAFEIPLILPAGTYNLSARLKLIGLGGTGQGYKIAISTSATTSGPVVMAGVQTANGVAAAVTGPIGTPVPTALTSAAAISSTVGDLVNVDGVITLTTTGVVRVYVTQNASSANATLLLASSNITATRVA